MLAGLKTPLWQHTAHIHVYIYSLTDTHCTDEMKKVNKSRNAGILMNAEVSGGQREGEERGREQRGTIHTHGSS